MRKAKLVVCLALALTLLPSTVFAANSSKVHIYSNVSYFFEDSTIYSDSNTETFDYYPVYDSEVTLSNDRLNLWTDGAWHTSTPGSSSDYSRVYFWGTPKMFSNNGLNSVHSSTTIRGFDFPTFEAGSGLTGRVDAVFAGYLYSTYTAGTGSSNYPDLSMLSLSMLPALSQVSATAHYTLESGLVVDVPATVSQWETGLVANYSILKAYSPIGITVTSSYRASEADPVQYVNVTINNAIFQNLIEYYGASSTSDPRVDHEIDLVVTSFNLISTSSTTADSLDQIADLLEQQAGLSSAYYGDILSICSDILEKATDIDAVTKQLLAYVSSLSSYLESIDSTTTDIYDAINKYFEQVLSAIDQNGDKISNSIDSAEKRLEEYLKPLIDYINSLQESTGESSDTIPQHKADVDSAQSDSAGLDELDTVALGEAISQLSSFSLLQTYLTLTIGVALFVLFIKKGLS